MLWITFCVFPGWIEEKATTYVVFTFFNVFRFNTLISLQCTFSFRVCISVYFYISKSWVTLEQCQKVKSSQKSLWWIKSTWSTNGQGGISTNNKSYFISTARNGSQIRYTPAGSLKEKTERGRKTTPLLNMLGWLRVRRELCCLPWPIQSLLPLSYTAL